MARRADVDALIAGFERCASTAPLFAEDSSSDERASARRLEDDARRRARPERVRQRLVRRGAARERWGGVR